MMKRMNPAATRAQTSHRRTVQGLGFRYLSVGLHMHLCRESFKPAWRLKSLTHNAGCRAWGVSPWNPWNRTLLSSCCIYLTTSRYWSNPLWDKQARLQSSGPRVNDVGFKTLDTVGLYLLPTLSDGSLDFLCATTDDERPRS